MKHLAIATLILASCAAHAALGDHRWSAGYGSATSIDIGYGVTTDADGNVYTTGWYGGTVDFEPGPGTTNLSSSGVNDIYIQKLDRDGTLLWARSIGNATFFDVGNAIVVDASQNVYIAGYFAGAVDFDPGAGTQTFTSAGGNDGFLLKLDPDGEYVWAIQIGGTGVDEVRAIALDTTGNPHLVGRYSGTADLDSSPSSANVTAGGGSDVFVVKYNADGTYAWGASLGGTATDDGRGIGVDSSGNVYTSGLFNGTADFDPSGATANLTSAGSNDIFISKLDNTGAYVWAKQVGSTTTDVSFALAADSSGNSYTTGSFTGTVDFDPNAGTEDHTSAGASDLFVLSLDASGNLNWAVTTGGTLSELANAITIDPDGSLLLSGLFSGTSDFDPSASTADLTAIGGSDAFVLKLDDTGNYIGAFAFGGSASDEATGIAADPAGNILVTGHFNGTADLDPGTGTENYTAAGLDDIFLVKLAGPDATAPEATAIVPDVTSPTNADTIVYTITFSEDVLKFNDAADLVITHTGTADTGVAIAGGPAIYTATLSGVSGDGTIEVSVNTASDIEDFTANPLGASVSSNVTIDNTAPSFSAITAIPSTAVLDDTVTITFAATESTASDPEVTVNGNPATRTAKGGVSYTYEYTVLATDPIGPATIVISGEDAATNEGADVNNTALTIDTPPPAIPVVAWPAALALAVATGWSLRRKR